MCVLNTSIVIIAEKTRPTVLRMILICNSPIRISNLPAEVPAFEFCVSQPVACSEGHRPDAAWPVFDKKQRLLGNSVS